MFAFDAVLSCAQGMLRGDFGEGDTVIVSAPGGTEADGLRLEVNFVFQASGHVDMSWALRACYE